MRRHHIRIAGLLICVPVMIYLVQTQIPLDAVWFWGGTKCETTRQIKACFGYGPWGMVVVVGMGIALALAGEKAVCRLNPEGQE
jgi:hypothetical protein